MSVRRWLPTCPTGAPGSRAGRCSCACGLQSARWSVSNVTGIVRRACERAGVAPAGAHRLRHSAATAMLRAGAPLAEIGQVLRQSHAATTAVYARVDRVALRALAQPWPGALA